MPSWSSGISSKESLERRSSRAESRRLEGRGEGGARREARAAWRARFCRIPTICALFSARRCRMASSATGNPKLIHRGLPKPLPARPRARFRPAPSCKLSRPLGPYLRHRHNVPQGAISSLFTSLAATPLLARLASRHSPRASSLPAGHATARGACGIERGRPWRHTEFCLDQSCGASHDDSPSHPP